MDKLKLFFSKLAHNFRYNEYLRKKFAHGVLMGTFASILIHTPVLLAYYFGSNYPENHQSQEIFVGILFTTFFTASGFVLNKTPTCNFPTMVFLLMPLYIFGMYTGAQMFYIDPYLANDFVLALFFSTLIYFVVLLIAEHKKNNSIPSLP